MHSAPAAAEMCPLKATYCRLKYKKKKRSIIWDVSTAAVFFFSFAISAFKYNPFATKLKACYVVKTATTSMAKCKVLIESTS